MTTEDTRPPLAAGFSYSTSHGFNDIMHVHRYTPGATLVSIQFWRIAKLLLNGVGVVGDDGVVSFLTPEQQEGSFYIAKVIPDAQKPAGGMTKYHKFWNEETQKYELPDLFPNIRGSIEGRIDFDVHLATALHRSYLDQLDALTAVRDIEYKSENRGRYNTAISKIANNAESVLKHFWPALIAASCIDSFIRILSPTEGTVGQFMTDTVAAAQDSGVNLIAEMDKRSEAGTLSVAPIFVMEKFLEMMKDDLSKTAKARNRNWKRGLVIVESLSSPAVAGEVTAAAVLTKVLLTFTEGQSDGS